MDFTIQEAINLITHFYTPLPGYWKEDYKNYPEACRFIEAGFASFEDEREDKYILNQEGREILHPYIEQISLNLIEYSKRNGFRYDNGEIEILEAETISWFMKEYEIGEEVALEIYKYICDNLETYQYTATWFYSKRKGNGYMIKFIGEK